MDLLGKKIKTLRKNKKITQEQLAEILSISAQSVSKWENCISAPDIELLPIIARYFGITMDELFNFRLDALNYKEKFIQFMADNGVLKFGEFKLQSGRISPYFINTANYKSAAQITKLGKFYAECIRENNIKTDTLVGNANGDIPMVIATSMILYKKYGMDVNYCAINEIGKELVGNDSITLIKDTLTSGKTIQKALQKIKEISGTDVKNIIVSVDRMERSNLFSLPASCEIEKKNNIHIFSIVTLDDIIQALENRVIAGEEYLEEIKNYKEEYGGR